MKNRISSFFICYPFLVFIDIEFRFAPTRGQFRQASVDAAILPVVEGSAWITGEHLFEVAGDDPLRRGFRL